MATEMTNFPTSGMNGAGSQELARVQTAAKVGGAAPVQPQEGRAEARDAKEVSRPELMEAVKELNAIPKIQNHSLRFSVDDSSGRTVVKVIDAESEEVIRQIPPEEVLEVARKVQEYVAGEVSALLVRSSA